MRKYMLAALCCIMSLFILTGCKSSVPENTVFSVDDLSGKKIGVQLGTTGDTLVSDYEEDGSGTVVERYNKGNDAILALKQGKIDAVVIDVQPAQSFVKTNSELMILNEEFVTEDYAMCISKNKPELKASINEALNVIKANGTLDKIIDNYIGENAGKTFVCFQVLSTKGVFQMEFLNVMLKVWMKYWNLFLQGLGMTLFMGLLTVLISTVFGSLMALMRRSNVGIGKFKPLRLIATVYVEIIRGTPILLQLYFFYFMLPTWLPFFNLSEFTCVMTACCVNSTAYVCEIVRAGIQAVDVGQTEAARSLGLNARQTMIHIVLPQAVKNILPALCNEFVAIVKETSLASTFFIGELMTQFKTINGLTFRVLEPLTIVGIIYFGVTFIMSKLIALLERRMNASER